MNKLQSSTRALVRAFVFAALLFITTAICLPAQTLTTIHSFSGPDGNNPQAALLQTSGGDLFGVTIYGGDNNLGTVFSVNSRRRPHHHPQLQRDRRLQPMGRANQRP